MELQQSLFASVHPRPARRYVPDTSKLAHVAAVNSGRLDRRMTEVLGYLIELTALTDNPPTTAELARHVWPTPRWARAEYMAVVLFVRRGMSDLQKSGLVAKCRDRQCSVTETKANTWKAVKR